MIPLLNPSVNEFAVMGNPIAHSLSPLIHHYFARKIGKRLMYKKIRVENLFFEQEVKSFFAQGGQGLNITAPFKQRAYLMADHHSFRCQEAKTANTLWLSEGKLYADNTDGIGFIVDISRYVKLTGSKILLLGAGGAARGLIGPLLAADISELTVSNRNRERLKSLLQDFPQIKTRALAQQNEYGLIEYDLIINATSCFSCPPFLSAPSFIPLRKQGEERKNLPFCYDLCYSLKGHTPFLQWAFTKGCKACDGLGMLIEQAAEAFFIWHGLRPKTEALENKVHELYGGRL